MNKNTLKQILKKVNDPSYQIEVSEHSDSTKASANADVIFKIRHILRKEDLSAYKAWKNAGFDQHYNFPMETPSCFGGLIVAAAAQQRYFSLLQVAASSGYTNVMKALIEDEEADIVQVIAPASVNINNKKLTKRECDEERKKPIVNRKDILGRTLLHLAAESGNIETAWYLLDNGAEIDAKGCGYTSLFWAALHGDKKMVQFLLDKKADIHIKNDKNQSLLHLAVIEKNIAAVRILLEEGLNPNEKDKDGKTPMDLAQDSSIKRALEKHIPNKLWLAVLTRNPETANKILNHCRNNDNIAEVLSFPQTLFLSKEQIEELSKQDNKDIIKAMQKTQVVEFGTVSATVAIWGAIAVGIAMYFSSPIVAIVIGAIALTITAPTAGCAIFHALKEFPSAQVNETRSTEVGAEARIPG